MFSILKLFIIVLVYCATDADSKKYRFDYTYYREVNGWLKFHPVPAAWREARLRCGMEGGVLASPITPSFSKVMETVMTLNNIQACGAFTGTHATFSKGDYFSIEGIPLTRMTVTWAPGEPDNLDNTESCLILLTNGSMADVNCTDAFPYMCYKKDTGLTLNRCNTFDEGYKYEEKTQRCYKFHVNGKEWSRAHMTCAAEGGHLAIINSEVEAEVLKNLFATYPTNVILSPYKNSALLGFLDWDEQGSWRTIHGEDLDEAGYKTWSPGQPDNAKILNIGEYYGCIFRTARLDDIWCNVKAAFICEMDPAALFQLYDY